MYNLLHWYMVHGTKFYVARSRLQTTPLYLGKGRVFQSVSYPSYLSLDSRPYFNRPWIEASRTIVPLLLKSGKWHCKFTCRSTPGYINFTLTVTELLLWGALRNSWRWTSLRADYCRQLSIIGYSGLFSYWRASYENKIIMFNVTALSWALYEYLNG